MNVPADRLARLEVEVVVVRARSRHERVERALVGPDVGRAVAVYM